MFNFDFLLSKKKQIFFIFLFSVLIEMLSFVSFNFPYLNYSIFFIIASIFLVLSIYKLEWGIYIILTEVFLNSMGYLFYFENSGLKMSLRIALWLIIMSIFLTKILLRFFNDKEGLLNLLNKFKFKNIFIILALFLFFSFIYGFINNGFGDAFSDFSAWLYFLIILPLFYVIESESANNKNKIWQNIVIIFISISLYISFKSFLFLYLFSHDFRPIISDLYTWTRRYYLGEITNMNNGVYRIFLQNQIFSLLALFFSFSALLFNKKNKIKKYLIILSSFFISTIIISFSRSFWLALILSLVLLLFLCFYKFKLKKSIKYLGQISISIILSLAFIFIIVKFPWPATRTDFGIDSLSARANISASESAISSRWALLEVMKEDIKSNFLFGRGFGARLEYISSDPRVLETSPDGKYSTYAFEWGWLDILLKLGFFGFLIIIVLISLFLFKSLKIFFKENNFIFLGIFLSLLTIIFVNFFTPYLNHPLGISYLIILFLFFDYNKNYYLK